MKLSFKTILPIIFISALLILLAGCTGIVPDDNPSFTPGSITGRIMVPIDCTDCQTTDCISKSNNEVPFYWIPVEGAIVTVIPHATLTDENGYYTLSNIEPGVYYVITATYGNLVLKDIVEPPGVKAGEIYDAGTANCESTALGLIVEALLDMGLDPEDIELALEIIKENPKFDDLVDIICCIIEDCDNVTLICGVDELIQDIIDDEPGYTCPPLYQNQSLVITINNANPCWDICTTISSVTVRYTDGTNPDLTIIITPSYSGKGLSWSYGDTAISFNPDNGKVCLTGGDVDSPYTITCTYTDPCGTTISGATTVNFKLCDDEPGFTCPLPTADAGGPYIETLVCPEDGPDDDVTVSFSGSASGAGTFTYDWDFGDGGSSTLQNPTHTYAGPTADFYTVTLTVTGDGENTCGSDTDATTVNINYVPCEEECPLPTADAGGPYIETLVCEDGDEPGDSVTVTFSGSASGAGTFTYDWDFGDGGSSTLQNPTHTYAGPTADFYTVTLTVTGDGENTCGSDTDATTVNINYVPCCPPPISLDIDISSTNPPCDETSAYINSVTVSFDGKADESIYPSYAGTGVVLSCADTTNISINQVTGEVELTTGAFDTYTITVTYTDPECGDPISDTVQVTFAECPPCPPPISLDIDISSTNPPCDETSAYINSVTVSFDGKADESIYPSYAGTGVVLSCADTTNISINQVTGEVELTTGAFDTYTITVTYTDPECGDPISDTVQVTFEVCCEPCVVDFIAGQTIDVGSVEVSTDGVNLIVKLKTTGCWYMTETHLYVGTEAPTNSAPGQLGYQHTSINTQLDTYTIPLSSISNFKCDEPLYIATHAVVNCSGGESETAWGEGTDFGGGWAMYFQCPIACECID